MKVDIHVHSKFSTRPSQWILQKIGCPESFTDPLQVYHMAKDRGMTHVTLTDHNTIDGALEIAHLPNTFISEEITTYFPDDGCKIHVLALNITEDQHGEIQKVREDIYALTRYLFEQKILNIVAHPLYAINDRLKASHFEQLLLLFQNFELNGARNQRENDCLKEVLSTLTPKVIERLVEKHSLTPLHPQAWEKRLWGGTDDHSALNIARTYTQIKGLDNPRQLRLTLTSIQTEVVNRAATPLTMGHNLYSIAYQFYRTKFDLDRIADKDILMRFLDRQLRIDINRSPGLLAKLYLLWQHRKDKKVKGPASDSLMAILKHESRRLIHEDPDFFDKDDVDSDFRSREEKWFVFVNRISNRVMLNFGDHLLGHLSGANLFNIFATLGSAGGLYTLLAPYFVAFSQFSKDRHFSRQIREQFRTADKNRKTGEENRLRVGHFTDTFYEVNGVALTLQQHVRLALKTNKDYILITCHNEDDRDQQPGVRNFTPIGCYDLPEYPEQKIFYPPLLEMLEYCYSVGFNHLHTATPGPIGLAALAIAKILKLPITGTYHTAIPQYAQILTDDEAIQDLSWKYVLWYYDQLDLIYAPSKSTCDELVHKGIRRDKIRIYPRGIDTEQFNPAKRNGVLKKLFSIKAGLKFIYVGRVSKEKNLHLLASAFRKITHRGGLAHLIVVGEGPYLEEMRNEMQGFPCHFTGFLRGEKLSEVFASADVFVFPSATDTFGNVVLEAQASGLPVIVTNQGGPCENIIPNKTGLIIEANDVGGLMDRMRFFLDHPRQVAEMGAAARNYVEQRSFENAFMETWEMFNEEQTGLMARIG
jgi:glycosyltransferase involved in cell wall biosynthesis